jgi:DNA-binding LacI/PurR family transcriptional regulator
MMTRKVASSTQVAARAGVSQATVSYVLNGRADKAISMPTRERVLRAASDLNYRPNRLVNGVLRGQTRLVGVIAPWLGSPYHAKLLDGIRSVLDDGGYHAFLSWGVTDADGQAKSVELLLEHRVDGIIYISDGLAPEQHAARWLRSIVAEGVSCVVLDDRTHRTFVDSVVSDDIGGAKAAIHHLAELGHKRIAFWPTPWDSSTFHDRAAGYRAGLAEMELEYDPALDVIFPQDVRKAAVELHSLRLLPNPPTAFFFANDHGALITQDAARELGYRVPEDIAICGFSDISNVAPIAKLTSVRQDSTQMGKLAAKMLLERLAEPDRMVQTLSVPTELVIRGSTVHCESANQFDAVQNYISGGYHAKA